MDGRLKEVIRAVVEEVVGSEGAGLCVRDCLTCAHGVNAPQAGVFVYCAGGKNAKISPLIAELEQAGGGIVNMQCLQVGGFLVLAAAVSFNGDVAVLKERLVRRGREHGLQVNVFSEKTLSAMHRV